MEFCASVFICVSVAGRNGEHHTSLLSLLKDAPCLTGFNVNMIVIRVIEVTTSESS